MKINKKIVLISAATILSTTPIIFVNHNQSSVVQAAHQTATGTLRVDDSYAYVTGKGTISLRKGQSLKYYGAPKTDLNANEGGNYFPSLQFNIGNGNYVSLDYVKQISGPQWLTVVNNSYLYNKNGKKLATKIKRWENLAYPGKIKPATNQRFYFNLSQKKYIPYRYYKNVPYYNLGKGHYVRVSDIGFVNGNALIAKNGQTTGIVSTNNARTYTSSEDYANSKYMAPTARYLNKGQKFTFDKAVTFSTQLVDADHDPCDYYRIKGTNLYISGNDLYLSKQLVSTDYENLNSTRLVMTEKAPLYDASGKKTNQFLPTKYKTALVEETDLYEYQHADELLYLWVPSENKAELFYHVVGHPDIKTNSLADEGYIKQAAVSKTLGLSLKVANTAAQAEAANKVATNKDQLKTAINNAENIQSKDIYKLADYDLKVSFDTYLKNAEDIVTNKSATEMVVQQAEQNLTKAQKALNGKKLKIGNYDQLTLTELQKIMYLAYNAVKTEHMGDVDINLYSRFNNAQYIAERPLWDLGQGKGKYWLGYTASDSKGKHHLNIHDFAIIGKKRKTQKLAKQYYLANYNDNNQLAVIYNGRGKVIKKFKVTKDITYKVIGYKRISGQLMYQIGKDKYIAGLSTRYVIKK